MIRAQDQIAQRRFMCPEFYHAAFSGDAVELDRLLATVRDRHDGQACSLEELTAGLNTVLHVAAGKGHIGLVTRLLQGAPEEAAALLLCQNSRFETALHLAVRAGHHETALHLILTSERTAVLEVLLQGNRRGDTALHVAARHGRQPVVESLMVNAPALPCVLNHAGASPLYLAVISRSVGIVKALVQWRSANGETASAAGPNGQNALHAAALQSAG